MKTLKVIDSIIQIGLVLYLLIETNYIRNAIFFICIFLGLYQIFSQFIFYNWYKKTKPRKKYNILLLTYGLGAFIMNLLLDLYQAHFPFLIKNFEFIFLSCTIPIITFYLYISFTETYKEIVK
jgi:hypothetical protein